MGPGPSGAGAGSLAQASASGNIKGNNEVHFMASVLVEDRGNVSLP